MIMLTEGLTWHYVIDSAMLAPIRAEQRRIIRDLFLALAAPSRERLWPSGEPWSCWLREAPDDAARLRVVADTIASLTERQVMQHYALLAREGLPSAPPGDVQ